MKKVGIYKITSPSKRIYIGQSVDIDRRFKQYHKMTNCHEQSTLFRSLNKYGVSNHKFEVLEICNRDVLTEKEAYWIDYYKSNDKRKGMNIRCAGSKGKLSTSTKKKISKANKGKKRTVEQRLEQSKRLKENPISFWLGKKRSKEDRIKMSISHIGKKGRLHPCSKKIIQFDLFGNKLNEFYGASEASRVLGIQRSSIKNNLIGLSKTCNKSIFKYAN